MNGWRVGIWNFDRIASNQNGQNLDYQKLALCLKKSKSTIQYKDMYEILKFKKLNGQTEGALT